ncbi:hypothetical protein MITS9509_03103 [Synechococcus sp. MIT S9509]|uniref:hypothetical protein n=1 Tax=unclassified Synechococcus TaxID=2626047 RepID=UPI0007BBA18D|nr:hypothetical protein MITS9504_03172 [Synechococcus sp. MIT S9504]KZR89034.1 hypothetical protein MITS9509_03103 [Synechococcus sp. MIT S9509]
MSRKPLARSSTEGALFWFIQMAVLRRKVDGQGLTERVRLTPIGRVLLEISRNKSHLFTQAPGKLLSISANRDFKPSSASATSSFCSPTIF